MIIFVNLSIFLTFDFFIIIKKLIFKQYIETLNRLFEMGNCWFLGLFCI